MATKSAHGDDWTIALGETVRVAGRGGGDATPRARKARALVAYLAHCPGRTATRADLIAVLWSDRGREQARASLRQCLFELRGEAPGLIAADGEQIALAAAVATLPQPAGRVMLGDLDALDPGFDRWLAARRGAWPAADGAAEPVARPARRRRRPVLAGIVIAVIAVIGAAGWLLRPAAPHSPAAALLPLTTTADPAARAAATRFAESMGAMLAPSRVRRLPVDAGRADWIVGGTIATDAATARVTTPQGAVLWSAREGAAGNGIVAAADRLAHRAARTLACAAGGPPTRRDAAVTALLMDFCDVMQSGGFQSVNEAALALARRFVAVAPQDAYAHAHLATTLAINAAFAPPSLAAPARAEAQREAARALALDPRTGEAWLARALADDSNDFAEQEAALRRGLAAEPDNPDLPNYLAKLLTSVGRLDEALVEAQRGLAFDPASPAKHADVAWLLLRTGRPRAAFALLDDPGIYDPGRLIARRRVNLILWTGDMAAARDAISKAGDAFEPASAAKLTARARAVANPRGPEAAALLAQIAATGDDPDQAGYRVVVLASLGRTDAALDAALRAPVDTEFFFRPYTRALLLSPRFPAVARFQGLWAYWQTTGHWPDICIDPALGWRCPVKSPSMPR